MPMKMPCCPPAGGIAARGGEGVAVIADGGLCDTKRLNLLEHELGFGYVIRWRSNIWVTTKDGKCRQARTGKTGHHTAHRVAPWWQGSVSASTSPSTATGDEQKGQEKGDNRQSACRKTQSCVHSLFLLVGEPGPPVCHEADDMARPSCLCPGPSCPTRDYRFGHNRARQGKIFRLHRCPRGLAPSDRACPGTPSHIDTTGFGPAPGRRCFTRAPGIRCALSNYGAQP